MFRNNTKYKAKKLKGQHVVELALVMPLFVILFSYTFQIMVETFSKYKFSYVFTSAVRGAVEEQEIYTAMEDTAEYNFRDSIDALVQRALVTSDKIPYSDIQIGSISTDKMSFLIGAFQFVTTMLFLKNAGEEYFYFIIPLNSAYIEPMVLNKSTLEVESYFEWYFTLYAEKYYEQAESESDDSSSLYEAASSALEVQ